MPCPFSLPTEARRVEIGGLWIDPSLPALLQRRAAEAPYHPVAHLRDGARWRAVTLEQARLQVEALAAGLLAAGVQPGDRVAIVAETRAEWGLIDQAILHVQAVTVGVYPSLPAEDVGYVLGHAGAVVAVVEDAAQVAKLDAVRADLPDLRRVYTIDPAPGLPDLATLEAEGAALQDGAARVAALWRALEPDDLATLIYTSGTTGPPKGAMLSHGNLSYVVQAGARVLPNQPDDTSVVFLPMAHVLQRAATYGGLHTGAQAYFARSIQTLIEDLAEVEPTVQISVPRIWEKLHARIQEGVAAAPPRRQRIFAWALEVGREAARRRREGRRLTPGLHLRHAVAERLVHGRIRTRVFGRNIRYLTSGGAPIAVEVLEFFEALGLLILEGWGLTETAAPATLNLPDAYVFGSVGRPLEGTDVRVAEDGELLVRGPGVFQGYFRDEAATRAAFTEDGFFRTGDVGEVDPQGYVRITDRKKDIVVLSNGKNVAPQRIENVLTGIPLVGHALAHGDGRSYLVGLLTLDPEAAFAWGRARRLVPADADPEDRGDVAEHLATLAREPELRAAVDAEVRSRQASLPRHEQLKAWSLIGEDWTPESGELTPTLKPKRRVITARHRERIEQLYAGATASHAATSSG